MIAVAIKNNNMNKKLNIGDPVALVTDPEKYRRMITAIIERANHFEYEVSFCEDTCVAEYFELELL